MEHRQVKSSSIESIGFSEQDQFLEVKFTSGAIYRYSGVSKQIADAFLQATPSLGHHFQTFIRPCFPCERVHAEGCGKYLECSVVNCECWCHKQRKDVSDAKVTNPNLEKELRASIKAAKAKKRG